MSKLEANLLAVGSPRRGLMGRVGRSWTPGRPCQPPRESRAEFGVPATRDPMRKGRSRVGERRSGWSGRTWRKGLGLGAETMAYARPSRTQPTSADHRRDRDRGRDRRPLDWKSVVYCESVY